MDIKRRLFFAERMMYSNGHAPFNAVLPFTIRGSLTQEGLMEALTALQKLHPMLQACVTENKRGEPMFSSAEAPVVIPLRILARTSPDQWQAESIREWQTAFDCARGPLIRLVWLESEEVSDFLLVFHHILCDGKSALLLLKELLLLLEHPQVKLPPEIPFLGLQELIPPQLLHKTSLIAKYRLIAGGFRVLLHLVPLKTKYGFRTQDYLLYHRLDKGDTGRLIAYCKSSGIKVNTLMSLAILEAFRSVRNKAAFNKITCPVDIRGYLPELRDDQLFASGLMIVLSDKGRREDSFMSRARALQVLADAKMAKLDAHRTLMMFEYAHKLLHRFVKVLKYSKPANDCMFSNLGNLALRQEYENFQLEEIRSSSVIGPLGNPNTIIISTFRGQLDFSFVSSENYLPRTEAIAIKKEIFSILRKQISIHEEKAELV